MNRGERDGRRVRLGLLSAAAAFALLTAGCAVGSAQTALAPAPEPCAALTFDDGPRRETTAALLDGLACRGVHATFFVVGTRMEGQEDLILRMEEEGHQVGIHSQNHKVLSGLDADALSAEVRVPEQRLRQLLGKREFMLRPPYGFTDEGLRQWVSAPIILWSVDPEDWADHDVARQVAAVVNRVEDGDIILLHDIYHASVETALQVADELLARGYRLVTVEELFALRGLTPEAGREYRCLPP